MAINSVDMDKALTSASYAQQVLRSGIATAEQRTQLATKWGSDFVEKYSSVDINDVKIDDVSYNAAKEAGKNDAANKTGYDGSTSHSSIAGAVPSIAGGAASIATLAGTKFLTQSFNQAFHIGTNVADKGFTASTKGLNKSLGMYIAATLAIATAAKYWIDKPNKEQVDATQTILNDELPQCQSDLYTAQADMDDATAETTALAEEAEGENEDAAEEIEEQKILFDFYREQYLAVKQKAEAGGQLTPDEKELMKQLAPLMEELGEGIVTTGEETSEVVGDLYDEIEEYQSTYDNSAETIAEVQGMTDFAEGFDETTRTMCYVEAGSQTINAASGAWAGAKLIGSGFWNWAFGIAALAASASSSIAATQQFGYASKVSNEIDVRRETQDIGTQTGELYEEELENFVGNMETTEDLELEMPEDLEVPPPPVTTGEGEEPADPLMAPPANNNEGTNNTGSTNGTNGLGSSDDDKKDKDKK